MTFPLNVQYRRAGVVAALQLSKHNLFHSGSGSCHSMSSTSDDWDIHRQMKTVPLMIRSRRRLLSVTICSIGRARCQLLGGRSDVPSVSKLCSMFFSSLSNTDDNEHSQRSQSTVINVEFRKKLLREKLLEFGCFDDIDQFEQAVQQSMVDPTLGYDIRYGKPAIKTCQSFYYPKKDLPTVATYDSVQWNAAATRTARQIEFLYKRHMAHRTEWIRHHDAPPPGTILPESDSRNPIQLSTNQQRFPFVLLLDNLRSAANVGSLYRTADATRCQEVITVGITPHPFGNGMDKVQKSSLGAEFTVPTRHFANVRTALEYVHQTYTPYQWIALETTSESIPYTEFPYATNYCVRKSHTHDSDVNNSDVTDSDDSTTTNHHNNDDDDHHNGIVLILGNEVTGVDISWYNNNSVRPLDGVIEIPMYGTKNSLNVAVCAPIVLYEILRQQNMKHMVTTTTQ
jgi:23S rRNA (guanosine2251-2'-O)-methyltransferase